MRVLLDWPDDAALFRDGDGWLLFRSPVETWVAETPEEVPAMLRRAAGRWVAGWVGYEAAPGFDPALAVRRGPEPVACLRVYAGPPERWDLLAPWGPDRFPEWPIGEGEGEFRAAFARVREALGAGRVYQANLTRRVRRPAFDPRPLFREAGPDAPYSAFVTGAGATVACLSPELFYRRRGRTVECRPMKGTAPPGAPDGDLTRSEKERAENLMIVDMVRNDLGRVADVGSVRPEGLFRVERYPTVAQMTSGVLAETDATLPGLFAALFPCASVTGAPKVEAMRLIAEVEGSPRGVYCGAVGWSGPDEERWAVAIRTLTVREEAVYGVGSGVVWDSSPGSEWAEGVRKARALAGPEWSWLETMPRDPAVWPLHRARMGAPPDLWDAALAGLGPGERVRVTWGPEGLRAEASAPPPEPPVLRAAVSDRPVWSADPWLRVKTTNRRRYDERAVPGHDETLLVNERGEATEFLRGNLLVRIGGEWFTPPVGCGLLPGVGLARLGVSERVMTIADVLGAERVERVSSLRGRVEARLARP